MMSKTDPLGNTTSYTYIVGTNWLLTETDPMGHVEDILFLVEL
jgi:hypothetical protein